MKGIELPINTIVIIVIVLVVLLAIIGLFFGVWNPGRYSISLEAAKNNACQMLISTGCGDTSFIKTIDFDVGSDGITDNDNLQDLCETYYNVATDDQDSCREICHCE